MIVSHKHRFIFMKSRKTAGTSVELALSRHCGPDDIITPNLPEDESLRAEIGGVAPQNHHRPLKLITPKSLAVWAVKKRRPILYDHISAKRVRKAVGREVWDSYFKFTIERNPWDAAVSYYFFRTRLLDHKPSISEWLRGGDLDILKRNYRNVYTIDGQVAVDKVCRFEHLQEDVGEVWSRIGLPEPMELPRANVKFRADKRHYSDVLSPDDAAFVREKFAPEIALLGYEY